MSSFDGPFGPGRRWPPDEKSHRYLHFLSASWNLNKVLGFRMTASLGIRLGGTNSNPIPRRRRSDEFRLGARRRARLLMSSWCLSNKDSATTARTPPGRRSLAMVTNRWRASISRCIIDRDGSRMPVSHKTARDDPFYMCKDLRIRHAQVYRGRKAIISAEQVRRLKGEGLGGSEIARRLGIGRASVYRLLEAD
jgi:hypothetical protein